MVSEERSVVPPTAATVRGLGKGEIIAGRYAIEGLTGSGGVGAVYRARRLADGRLVALKVLLQSGAVNRARFQRECDLLGSLHHPAVVEYLDHGLTDEGDPFLVMEWLEGHDLGRRLARGPLPLADALALGLRIAQALGAVHAIGVIHRDVKPANIFLAGGDVQRACLVDFGLARAEQPGHLLTRTGALLGTPGYMAPEQVQSASLSDARTDVFALGCVLYECLTGRAAYQGHSLVEALAAVLRGPPEPPSALRPTLPSSLDRLLASMLAADPAARPASGDAVASLLSAILAAPAPDASDPAPLRRSTRAVLAAPAPLAWALLADTDRWDRIAGAPPSSYSIETVSLDGRPAAPARVGASALLGQPVRWVEEGDWIEGEHFVGERRYLDGPFHLIRYAFRLGPHGDGCQADLDLTIDPRPDAPEGLAALVLRVLSRQLDAYLAHCVGFLPLAPSSRPAPGPCAPTLQEGTAPTALPAEPRPSAPSSLAAWLAALPHDPLLHGPPRPEPEALATLLARLPERSRGPIGALLRRPPPRLRPRELSRLFSVDLPDMLDALLAAAKAGLLDLRLVPRCAACRAATDEPRAPGRLDRVGHCGVCSKDFTLDLASTVEVVFTTAQAAGGPGAVYCEGSPAFRPHVFALLRLAPGDERKVTTHGPLEARVLRGPASLVLDADRLQARPSPRRDEASLPLPPATQLTVTNPTATDLLLSLERPETLFNDALLASEVLGRPGYHELLCLDAPADGADLATSHLVLALLEADGLDEPCLRLGDGAALSLSLALRAELSSLVAAHQGTVLSDAHGELCALFSSAADALAACDAGRAAAASLGRSHGAPGLGLRAAVARGPSLLLLRPGRTEVFGRPLLDARRRLALASASATSLPDDLAATAPAARPTAA